MGDLKREIADGLVLGLLTLTRWKREPPDVEVVAIPNPDVAIDLARLIAANARYAESSNCRTIDGDIFS